MITATVVGIRGVEREFIWSAAHGCRRARDPAADRLPAALPQIFTGLQVALPIALIVAVVTEMLMGGYGLGGAMMTASRFADLRGVFAGIVEIAVVGYVLVKGMAIVRRRLLLWHQEALTPSTKIRAYIGPMVHRLVRANVWLLEPAWWLVPGPLGTAARGRKAAGRPTQWRKRHAGRRVEDGGALHLAAPAPL